MPEIVAGATKEPEKTIAPSATPEPEQQEPEYSETERNAMSQGWKPKDQWEGNPDDHRSAREFLDRGELLSKIKSQSQELRQVQQIVGVLSDHNKKVYLAGYNKALQELRAQKAVAINERDGEKIVAIEEKIDAAKAAIAAVEKQPATPSQPTQGTITPDFQLFMNRNPWYQQDAAMRAWAHGEGIAYANDNKGATEGALYMYLEGKVKEAFPDKFNKQNRAPPSPDGEGRQSASGTRSAGTGSFEKLMQRLPEEHSKTAKEMVKRGIVSKEDYVKQYEQLESGR